jgi:GH24 family phage-related lysozyme (muramidase)
MDAAANELEGSNLRPEPPEDDTASNASTLRRRLNSGDRDGVSEERMRWTFSNHQRLPGLVRRRQAEAKLYTQGRYE